MTTRLLTEKETCAYLNVSRAFLARQRSEGERDGRIVIPYVKLGRAVRYDLSTLDRIIQESEHKTPTSN